MAQSENTAIVFAGTYRGTMRFMERCSIITPETEYQGGLRYPADVDSENRPSRLFFGEQTDEGSMGHYARARIEGLAVEVEVKGYFKHRTNAYGEDYLDESALFVEHLTIVG